MGSLGEIFIKTSDLQSMAANCKKNGENGIKLTVSIHDNTNEYGQNISVHIAQTQEEREDEVEKEYVGNGKIFWTDGNIEIAEKRKGKKSDNKAKGKK